MRRQTSRDVAARCCFEPNAQARTTARALPSAPPRAAVRLRRDDRYRWRLHSCGGAGRRDRNPTNALVSASRLGRSPSRKGDHGLVHPEASPADRTAAEEHAGACRASTSGLIESDGLVPIQRVVANGAIRRRPSLGWSARAERVHGRAQSAFTAYSAQARARMRSPPRRLGPTLTSRALKTVPRPAQVILRSVTSIDGLHALPSGLAS